MAFDVMSLLAASGMLPNAQRNAQPASQQPAPIFNALLNDPQFQTVTPGAPIMPPPEPVPLGPYNGPAPEPVPLGPYYGPPSGYDPMAAPLPYEQELYGSPTPMPLSSEAFGAPAPIAMPTGPVARPAINLPPIPPPGFAQRREPVMGFAAAPAQPSIGISAQAPRAQFEYPSMFDMFLAAQPSEDIAYNAPVAEGPAAPAKEEEDKELTSWRPGTGFTFNDPADKEGKRKIEVINFTPSSQQGKGSAQLKTPRGTIFIDENSKLWPQAEGRYQSLMTGYQQRAAEGLATPPSNQYAHFVTLEDGTKAPMTFDANGEMVVEDPTYGSIRMDPTDVDPKSIIFPIDPKTGKTDTTQYQAAIKAIGKGVTEPLQETIQTAKGAVPSQRYSDPQTLSETTKFNISYDEFGLPKYSVVPDPNYPPGYAERLQADFDRDYKETRDAIQAELGFYLESGESIKDARIRQLRQEIDTLTPIATGAGGSSAAMTMAPGLTPDEASKAIAKKQQTIEEILKGGETIQLGNSVILQVGPAQTLTPIYNPTSWAAASARRRGMSTMAGNPESGAVLTPEQHGRFLVQSAVEPYVQQLGGMPPMTLTNESKRAIEATQGRINNIVNDAVGQYGKSGKLGVKARDAFANEPVTFTYKLGGQVITETMPLQQAVTEWRDAVQASQRAMATRSELEIIDAGKGLNSATRRFSGTIDVPYIDGGTTYIPTREEKSLINALFQQQVIPQDMVSTPMTLSPDTRTVTQQQPIAGEIPRPPAGSTPKGPPGVILPVFNLPTVETDAGKGVGRMGVGAGSGILTAISNAPPASNATIFWLKDNSPGVAAKSAKDNLFLAMHGDGNPAGLTTKRPDGTTQADDISAAVKATNKQMLTDSELRNAYARAFYDVLADLGYRDPNTSDSGFAADWEAVVLGRMNEQAFINKYRTKLADKEFSDSKLGKQMALQSVHQKELKINQSAPESPMNLRFHQDIVAKIEQFARAGTLLGKGVVSGAANDGIIRLPTGHRIYFFPDPYDDAAQSFLGVPDIANGRISSYPELTPEQAAAYANDPNNLPSILKTPADLPGLHMITGMQGGKSATALGALIDVLVPKFQRDHPEIGANARINHGNSKDRRWSTNTKRIPDDEKKELNAAGVDAVYRAFVDVMVNHAVLPNDRTVRKEGTGTPTIFKVPYR